MISRQEVGLVEGERQVRVMQMSRTGGGDPVPADASREIAYLGPVRTRAYFTWTNADKWSNTDERDVKGPFPAGVLGPRHQAR